MRQLVSDAFPGDDGCLRVGGGQFRHLRTVLRVRPGDMVHVRLPDGALVPMTVAQVLDDVHEAVLQKAGPGEAPTEIRPGVRLWLFQFVAKPVRMELIVRQAAECGVERIVPVAGSFCQRSALDSVRKKGGGDTSRWDRIITGAMEQSGSSVRTQVLPCVDVAEAAALWQKERDAAGPSGGALALCLYERTERTVPLHEAVWAHRNAVVAALAVGAEGGIAPAEYEELQKCGFEGVHFATNILRCETAALYGMAALQSALMEKTVWQCDA